ncbi:MAG TPA: ComEC/Rec2 family competence protein [Verrucomicrobiae bacterium]|nr:ComEC/Rec2 family competence protein [Verrucomicrobiae bacterium]
MKRPLGLVALLYGGGLILGEFFQPSLLFLFSASLVLLAATLLLRSARIFLLSALILFVGWTNLTWRTAVLSPFDLRALLTEAPEDVAIRGRLLKTPSERIYLHDDQETFRTLAELEVTTIRRNGIWNSAFGKIIVLTPGILPEQFFAGQEVEISGVIAPPREPLVEGLFDYRNYLRRQGIYFQLKAAASSEWTLLSTDSTPPLSDRFLAWAKATMARGLPAEDKPLRLLWAMTLGSKNVLTREAYDPFIESGTMHIFAISGLHIALIAGILISLLRVLRVPRSACGVIVIPLIWFYTGATGWQPSAIRSTLMMSIVIGGWSLKRPGDLLNSLAAAALVILIWDPQQLFQASFQLSFFVVLSIALILPPLEKWRDKWLQTDPLLPKELIPRWRRWLDRPIRFVTTGLITSLAAWLGAWPLTVYYFHLFSPITLLANLIIVPISSLALASNLGSLICGAWLPWLTELFNFSGWFFMDFMMKFSERAIHLPAAFFYAPAPTLMDFGFYYGALLSVITGFAFDSKRRRWMLIAVVFAAGFYAWRLQDARGTFRLTAIPVNGGSVIHCDAFGKKNDLLINCGNDNAVEFTLKPFLQSRGVNRLPRLALTHGAVRDVGGATYLQELWPVRQIVTSSTSFRSRSYREICAALESAPDRWRKVEASDLLAGWTVLHPHSTNHFSYADDSALVLRQEIFGTRILLLSELGPAGQNALLESGADLRADVVIAGIPNRGEPLREPLLTVIRPALVIIVDSEMPATKRASTALRERLAGRDFAVVYTRDVGAVTAILRQGTQKLKAANGEIIWERSNKKAEPSRQRRAMK